MFKGDLRASGEFIASNVAQGGPPPSFLDQKAFETLVKNEVDILNLTAEKDFTQSERQLFDSIRNNIDRHRDTILDIAHIEDIVRSLIVSLVNKRVLYLRDFKEGLAFYGLLSMDLIIKGLSAFICAREAPRCRCHMFVQFDEP